MSQSVLRRPTRIRLPLVSSLSNGQPSAVFNLANARRASSTLTSGGSTLSGESGTLSWHEYLKIRGRKRRWELASTVPITTVAAVGGLSYFGVHTPQFMGLDPLLMCILCTSGVAGLGYLVGPVVGSQVWKLTHRKNMALIEAKDRQFHQHIKRNRVDPSLQGPTNPVPDFYGEKIGSMKDYRQWLRDQARYRKKATWIAEKQ